MSLIQSNKISLYHWVLFAVCFVVTAFAGTVSTLISVYLPVVVKDLLGDKNPEELNETGAFINSIFIYGAAFGGFIAGIISDKRGRKTALILSVLLYGVFTILTGYMNSWEGVVICRFLSGFGMSGTLVSTNTLVLEEWPKKSRAVFIGILSISFPVGIFSTGVIQYTIASWRDGFLIGTIPVLLSIASIWILKESPIWKRKRDHSSLNKTFDIKLFSKTNSTNLIIGSLIFGTMLIGLWAIFLWVPTWIQSLIPDRDGQHERGLSMMMLGMGGLTGGFVSGWIVNLIGHKTSMILSFLVCFLMSLILFKTNEVFTYLIYVEVALIAFFFGASQGVLSVYIPGLFATKVRGGATGFCFNIGRLFTATAVLFIGILESVLGGYGNALVIFSFVFLIGLAVTILAKDKLADDLEEETVNTIVEIVN